jgi:hypothetical protein
MEPRGCNQWQLVANGNGLANRGNKRKPLPWIATGCVRRSMVKRGSTDACRGLRLATPQASRTAQLPLVVS